MSSMVICRVLKSPVIRFFDFSGTEKAWNWTLVLKVGHFVWHGTEKPGHWLSSSARPNKVEICCLSFLQTVKNNMNKRFIALPTQFLCRRRHHVFWLSIHLDRPDRSCYHTVSWTARAISMKLTGNIHWPLVMTWLDFGGQRSRSQQAVEVANAAMSTLGHQSPHSTLFMKIMTWKLKMYCIVESVTWSVFCVYTAWPLSVYDRFAVTVQMNLLVK